jgi:Patatin phospholipase/CO dehydrogenase flavoprotein C-terminal domain/FAD binding domain in molybdopterin dehydrogenase
MHCPIMVEAYRHVSHHTVRNRGTIGGSLCHNDPAAEMPLVVNLLGASMVARSRNGERIIGADQFFRGNFETALEDSELLTEIRVPIPANGHGWSFQEVSQRKDDFALVAAAAMLTLKDGVCGNVRLGYRNVGETIFRLKAVEAQIEGQAPGQQLFSNAAKAAMKAVEPPSDLHADADYRRDLVMALTERVLSKAVERARLPKTLAFQVDLWAAGGELPKNVPEVFTRMKEILNSSRTIYRTEEYKEINHLYATLFRFLRQVPDEFKRGEDAQCLMSVARRSVHHIVNLVYRPMSPEGASKDHEFSRRSMEERWLAGYRDTAQALRHPEIFEPAAACDAGIFVFDFPKDDD